MDYARLRLALPGRPETELTDQFTGERPAVWDGDDLDIEFWLGSECARDEPVDITLIESITMEFRLTESTAAMLIIPQEILVADMEECTLDEWQNDDGQHGTFTLTAAEMNFANSVRRFWASFQVNFLNGYVRTMGAGYITVAQSLHGISDVLADGVLSFANGIASVSLAGTDYSWPVASTASVTRGDGTISVADGIASFTLNYFTYSWPVATS